VPQCGPASGPSNAPNALCGRCQAQKRAAAPGLVRSSPQKNPVLVATNWGCRLVWSVARKEGVKELGGDDAGVGDKAQAREAPTPQLAAQLELGGFNFAPLELRRRAASGAAAAASEGDRRSVRLCLARPSS